MFEATALDLLYRVVLVHVLLLARVCVAAVCTRSARGRPCSLDEHLSLSLSLSLGVGAPLRAPHTTTSTEPRRTGGERHATPRGRERGQGRGKGSQGGGGGERWSARERGAGLLHEDLMHGAQQVVEAHCFDSGRLLEDHVAEDGLVKVAAAFFWQEVPEEGKQFVRVAVHLGVQGCSVHPPARQPTPRSASGQSLTPSRPVHADDCRREARGREGQRWGR